MLLDSVGKWLFFLVCLLPAVLVAQNVSRKSVQAVRITGHLHIDGKLDEAEWQLATPAVDFVQNNPLPGKPASQATEVRLLYDDAALYVGAKMYDTASDSIFRQLSKRDNTENTDIFAIYLDTYNDRLNAFEFKVTASGVQVDKRLSPAGDDIDWNAVWYSHVLLDDNGWYVEMKIPFSALRFPKTDVQQWGVNFFREIRRHREQNYWNFVDPKIAGFVNQSGVLNGVEGVQAATRLFFYPYASSYLEHTSSSVENIDNTNLTFNGGMDIKYGINDAFTLDVTLIPDFGQVLPDNQVLNLSPFEVYFNERRQFFTEGTELFNKGDLFYSRRIGGRPINFFNVQSQLAPDETIIENPGETRLINSTKLSGRTKGGLGVGVLNSVTGNTWATVENSEGESRRVLTNPFSNYNVFVLDQSLKNNSYVTLINTSVMREGSAYDANVTATDFKIMDKTNTWTISGVGGVSQLYGINGGDRFGFKYYLNTGKVSGNFQYTIEHGMASDTYNQNDLGFLAYNNEMTTSLNLSYNWFEPYSIFLRSWTNFSINQFRLYNPGTFTGFTTNLSHRMLFKGFLMANVTIDAAPIGWRDYYETRTFSQYYQAPQFLSLGGWISSDYSKRLAIDAYFTYGAFNEHNRHELYYRLSPRWRVSDRLFIIFDGRFTDNIDDIGFVANDLNGGIIFGQRNRQTVENLLTARYSFNHNMDLLLRVRHYWSKAEYSNYHLIGSDGALLETDYNQFNDVSFNVFNVDLAYTWVFTPGSELSVVWKNVILESGDEIPVNYFSNIQSLTDLPQLNSLSVKVLFFLDYLWLRKRN
jgi:hypothetical protein